MNPKDPKDMARLWTAINASRDRLKPFREERLESLKQFVGSHFGDNGTTDKIPVNFLELAISIYVQQLVGGAPAAYVATTNPKLKASAADLKVALDYTSERIRLEHTLWRVVQDAMFGPGIVKIGMCPADPSKTSHWWSPAWHPFVDWVDLDDWVQDMSAKTWESLRFCGNRYRIDLEDVRNNELYDKEVRENLKATPRSAINEQGDEKAETIASGRSPADDDDYSDQVELWDIWLPKERLILTLAADDEKAKPLRVVKWEGPDSGPYESLGFNVVPSCAMPLPPVALWIDLHDLGNQLYRKLGQQALRQMSVLPIRGGTTDDMETLKDVVDGQAFRCDGEIPKEVRYGGPDQVNLGFFLGINELYNRFTGNLDVLGGLSSVADTASQEQMLGANASQRVVFMRRKLISFVDRIFTHLAFYLFKDPLVSMNLDRTIPGTDITVPVRWNENSRQGSQALYQISIEPYSLVSRTPQSQMQAMLSLWRNLVMPVFPILPPRNVVEALGKFLQMLADKGGLPELADLLPSLISVPEISPPPGGEEQGPGQGMTPGMPQETTRNYVRKSVSGTGRAGRESALAQALFSGGGGGGEGASMAGIGG